MKSILIVCPCSRRGNSIGLIAGLLSQFEKARNNGCCFDLFDTNFFEVHNPSKYNVANYYCIKKRRVNQFIQHIPGLRAKFAHLLLVNVFKKLLKNNKYEYVLFYKVPLSPDILVDIAHRNGLKTMLFPWGSEVLRASSCEEKHLKRAYKDSDFIIGWENSNLIKKALSVYMVPEERIIQLKVVDSIIGKIKEIPIGINREVLSSKVGIKGSAYNIICGYSGSSAHRHLEIIKALSLCRELLPHNYQLIFPVTYAANSDYVTKIKDFCVDEKLNAIFLTEYMSEEQMACLHKVTDLYINIQPSDSGCAFMIESLFCGNQIVTGKWLNYKLFEEFGAPYYLIDRLEDLPNFMRNYFSGHVKKIEVPKALSEKLDCQDSYDIKERWAEIFCM